MLRYFLLILLTLPLALNAQSLDSHHQLTNYHDTPNIKLDSLENNFSFKPVLNYEIGISTFTNFDGMYGFNNYVAPNLIFKPSSRWLVDCSFILGRSKIYNEPLFYNSNKSQTTNQTILSIGTYMRASYLVNDKLYIGGSAFISYDNVNSSSSYKINNSYINLSGKTFVGYKFSKSFKVEAGVSYGNYQRYDPYDFYR